MMKIASSDIRYKKQIIQENMFFLSFLLLSPPLSVLLFFCPLFAPVCRVQVWSVHGGQCLHELREHTHVVESVAFAPESAERALATAGSAGSEAGAMNKPRANGTGGRGPGAAATAWGEEERGDAAGGRAGRGRFLASGSRDKTVKLWNASVGQCLMTFVSTPPPPPPCYERVR